MAGFFRNSFRKKKKPEVAVSEPAMQCDAKAMVKSNGATSLKQGSDASLKSSSLKSSSSSNVTSTDTVKEASTAQEDEGHMKVGKNNNSFDSDNSFDNLPFVDALRGDSTDELRFDTPTLLLTENRTPSPLTRTAVQPSQRLKLKRDPSGSRDANSNRVTFGNSDVTTALEDNDVKNDYVTTSRGDIYDSVTSMFRGSDAKNDDVTMAIQGSDVRDGDPEFPSTLPSFTKEEYWETRSPKEYLGSWGVSNSSTPPDANTVENEGRIHEVKFRGACVIPQTLKQSTSTSSLGLHRDADDDLTCRVCGEKFRRPRILPCLHTFCTACIINLQTYPVEEGRRSPPPKTAEDSRELMTGSPAPGSASSTFSHQSGSSHRSSLSSPRSGNVSSEKSAEKSFERTSEKSSEKSRKHSSSSPDGKRVVLCPICLKETKVSQTLEELPRNYVAERRVAHDVFANAGVLRLECDSCAEYNESCLVTVRCMDCAENLCSLCELSHRRQKKTKRHQLVDVIPTTSPPTSPSLNAKRSSNQNAASYQASNQNAVWNHVTRLAPPRAIACIYHPGEDLKLFCRTCDAPVCRDCVVVDHRDHDCQFLCPELFRQQMNELQQLIKSVVPRVSAVDQQLSKVAEAQQDIRQKGDQVLGEITDYMDTYIAAIQQHRQQLLQQVEAVMEEKQRALHVTDRHLRQVRFDVEQTCRFVSDMIENASDVEILSVKRLITERLSGLKELTATQPLPVSAFIRFSPSEKGQVINNFQMFGRVVSRKASAAKSTLTGEGLNTARVSHESSLTLRVNSEDGNQYTGKDVQVKAWLIFQSQSIRSIPVRITALKDAAYSLKFTPVQTGTHYLHVAVDSTPIKDSPFRFKVKNPWREHKGVWHCCSACSSGGRLDVPCGCRGAMPGGFQGCSHGNPSHPGGFHWSCCGKMVQTSECSGMPRPRQSPVRQVTL